ncbi:MAG: hybrid sensor histidine kinase/response regulator, partial [Deferrisomatales bacterium]
GEGVAGGEGLDRVRRVYSLVRLSDGADGSAHLAVGLPPEQVYGAAGQHLTRNLAWLAAASVLAAALAAWVGRGVLVRPLDALARAARRLEAGELSARAGLHGAAGELGDLAGAFDAMAAALERRSAEAQQAEAELRASEARAREALAEARAHRERYESLLAATPDAVGIYDLQGHPQYLNPAFTETFGFTLDEVRGRRIPFVPEADREATRAAIAEVLAGRPARAADTRRLTKDGRVLEVSISAARYCGAGGQVSGLVTVLRDVTAHKRSATRLQQAQRLEALGQLAGGVAHDFNNLLTVINGSAELLLDDLDEGSPLRGQVGEILRAGQRAGDLTRQLLAFSRQQPLATRVVDLASAVSAVAKMLRRLIGEEVDLRLALDEGAGRVRIDPGQLEQVVLNLAVNARDAMPRGGVLEIRVEPVTQAEGDPSGVPPGEYAVLVARDTGQGMDPATLEHIFEPFFTTKAAGRGTGLGLATVHGVVTQSGGHLRVESEPGRGTTFRVYLPRVVAAPEVAGDRSGRAAPAGGTVLVAEDEDEVRFVVTRALEREGYTVLEAASPAQALELAAEHKLDLLLTDVVMPGMRGPELATRLREQEPGLRVLFMSGYTDDALGPDTLRVVGAGLLPKPFSREALVDAVVEAMARGRVSAA